MTSTHAPASQHAAVLLDRTPPGRWASAFATHTAHPAHHGTDLVYLLAAVPLAVAVVVALVVWRSARRERTRRDLEVRLGDPDPRARRQALDEVTDDVLARNATVLLQLSASERDPDVLDALAAAVARSRWEPTTDRDLVELRRWVAGGHARATASSVERALHDDDDIADAFPVAPPKTAPAAPPPVAMPTAPVAPAPAAAAPDAASPDVAAPDAGAPDAGAPDAEPVSASGDAPETVSTSSPALEPEPEPVPAPAVDESAPAGLETEPEPVPEPSPAREPEPETVAAAATEDEFEDLVPTVRALLGEEVDRVELRLLSGAVLRTWSRTDAGNGQGEGATTPDHAEGAA